MIRSTDCCDGLSGRERMEHIRENHPEILISDPPIKLA